MWMREFDSGPFKLKEGLAAIRTSSQLHMSFWHFRSVLKLESLDPDINHKTGSDSYPVLGSSELDLNWNAKTSQITAEIWVWIRTVEPDLNPLKLGEGLDPGLTARTKSKPSQDVRQFGSWSDPPLRKNSDLYLNWILGSNCRETEIWLLTS